jgi:hypothetical protein
MATDDLNASFSPGSSAATRRGPWEVTSGLLSELTKSD